MRWVSLKTLNLTRRHPEVPAFSPAGQGISRLPVSAREPIPTPYNCSVAPPRTGKQKLQRLFLYTLLILLTAAAIIWIADFAIFRIRAAFTQSAYGSVQVDHYYAIAQKNGKTQFIFDPPGPQPCVNALFPHANLKPCWYLTRHPEQRTDI